MGRLLSNANERKLRLGVAGLGRAFTVMLPTFTGDPRIALVAAADSRSEARQRFSEDFSAKAYETVEELCTDPMVEAVYVATPHQCHARHATLAAQHGKHLLVEKPIALSLAECSTIIETAKRAGVQLVVGHSHSFDAPVARLRAFRAARDTAQVDARLADVRAAAEGSANLVPRFIEAVDAGATVGEICAVLRSVFGQYVARERIA